MDGYYYSPVSCSHLNGLKKELDGLFTVTEETPLSFRLKVDKPFCLGLILAYIFNRWHKDGVSFDLLQVSMKENTLFLQICRDARLNHMNVELFYALVTLVTVTRVTLKPNFCGVFRY